MNKTENMPVFIIEVALVYSPAHLLKSYQWLLSQYSGCSKPLSWRWYSLLTHLLKQHTVDLRSPPPVPVLNCKLINSSVAWIYAINLRDWRLYIFYSDNHMDCSR